MNLAMLLSCGSFEGFFGRVMGQSRQSYLESYRHDWAWYYARGLLENGIHPVLYIPSLHESEGTKPMQAWLFVSCHWLAGIDRLSSYRSNG